MSDETKTGGGLIVAENYLALTGGGLADAAAANGEELTPSMLTRVKTPSGGATAWEIDDGLGNVESVREISGAFVMYRKRATLWGTEGQPVEGTKPYLIVDDHPNMARGYLVPGGDAGDLDVDLIDACRYDDGTGDIDVRDKAHGGIGFPYAEWGSSSRDGSRAKRLKEQRLVAILRQDDPFPLVLTIQPGSLQAFKTVVAKMRKPHYYYAVRLTLEKCKSATGQPYSAVRIAVAGEFPEALALRLKTDYVDPLTAAFSQRMVAVDE